ncbi:MAG: phage scaffolding protein [Chloroflexota bacterium]
MKREDLIKLNVAEDVVDKIMALHGADIEGHKTKLAATQTELDGIKKQLGEANTAIEDFKKLDVDGVKKAADEWKTKAEQAQRDAAAQLAQLKFDHALDGALAGAKAKNSKAVKALLAQDGLKYNEADGSIVGLKEQLEKIRSENDFLFESDTPAPKIVTGGSNSQVIGDAVVLAARKAAGLPVT